LNRVSQMGQLGVKMFRSSPWSQQAITRG